MISDEKLPELLAFKRLEKRFPFLYERLYGTYVLATDNAQLPVHRWFRFKESFSADLVKKVVEAYGSDLGKKIRLLDPFCGVGTSLVAAQELSAAGFDVEATGIETNPFIAFVARTKANWPAIQPERISSLGERILKNSRRCAATLPPLSSVATGRCISRYLALKIAAIRDAIRRDGNTPTHDALLLGLASAIEPVSKVRKDGRALRLVERTHPTLETVLTARWDCISSDAQFFQTTLPKTSLPLVIVGDGRNPQACGIRPGSLDLVLTSPPYPNNIDYSEVYKLELWLLGFIQDAESFLRLRYSTFRSHPTCRTPDPVPAFEIQIQRGALRPLLRPLLQKVSEMPRGWRSRLLLGYFSDMWRSLEHYHRCLRPGGLAVLIVGNSLHDGSGVPYVIPTDLAVATIAKCLGFQVKSVTVARSLRRRLSGNHFLRESIIVLKKVDGFSC